MSANFDIAYTEAALRFLESGVTSKIARQFKSRIEALSLDPFPRGSIKLKEPAHASYIIHRVRQGKHRIL